MSTTTTSRPTPPAPQPVTAPRPAPAPGRVVALATGLFLLLGAAGSLAGAAWLGSVDDDRREDGYLTTDETSVRSAGHALAVEEIDLNGLDGDWVLGRARLRVTGTDPEAAVFVGIAHEDDAAEYLRGIEYTTVSDVDDERPDYDEHAGSAPTTAPGDTDIWVAQASGTGEQSVTWTPEGGSWTAVVMNVDATDGVDVRADVGATVPAFDWLVGGLWAAGAGLGLLGGALVLVGLRRRGR